MPRSASTSSVEQSSRDIFEAHLRLLESILPPNWYSTTRQKHHPAWHRLDLLKAHVDSGGTTLPDLHDSDGLCLMAELLLDGFHVMTACGGRVKDLNIGQLANYGDAVVHRRILSVTPNPTHFLAVMTELSRAAYHVGSGHTVRAVEDDGLADLVVDVPGLELPVIIDCKHVGEDAGPNRFPKLVQNANRQIKAHEKDCYGVAVLDLTSRARTFILHTRNRPVWRQHIPPAVPEAENAIHLAIRGTINTSVGAVVLLWNEIRLRPEGAAYRLIINKRTRLLFHRNPKQRLPDELIIVLEKGAGAVSSRMRARQTGS